MFTWLSSIIHTALDRTGLSHERVVSICISRIGARDFYNCRVVANDGLARDFTIARA